MLSLVSLVRALICSLVIVTALVVSLVSLSSSTHAVTRLLRTPSSVQATLHSRLRARASLPARYRASCAVTGLLPYIQSLHVRLERNRLCTSGWVTIELYTFRLPRTLMDSDSVVRRKLLFSKNCLTKVSVRLLLVYWYRYLLAYSTSSPRLHPLMIQDPSQS